MSGISKENIKTAQEKFGALIENESARIERMKASQEVTDFSNRNRYPARGRCRPNPDETGSPCSERTGRRRNLPGQNRTS